MDGFDPGTASANLKPAAPEGFGKKQNGGALKHGAREFNRGATGLNYESLKAYLERRLLDTIDLSDFALLPDEQVKSDLNDIIAKLFEDEQVRLDPADQARAIQEIRDDVFGLGPLEPLLSDPLISDILVNSANAVYVEKGGKLELTPIRFADNAHLLRVIEKIVGRVGRRIDDTSPLVDARLQDGSRVNAVVPPVAIDGPALSIRRFGRNVLGADQLVEKLAFTDTMLQLLQGCITARLNVIISGGTGSGKTTLLNALSASIPTRERIVTIEDAAEVQLQQPHVVRMETRPANIDGNAAVSIRHLVVNALRMRPDRIIVGEVRGEEALDMLQAMNTGHDGSLTTVHANSPRDALGRLETMVTMANSNLGLRVIRHQIASAVNVVVQVARLSDGTRRVTHISEVNGMEGDIITMQDIFLFDKIGVLPDGRVSGRFRSTGIRPKLFEKLQTAGIELPLSVLQTNVLVNVPSSGAETGTKPAQPGRR
jgi:pilus assembly protein CpaF